jgi:hypothetical protein
MKKLKPKAQDKEFIDNMLSLWDLHKSLAKQATDLVSIGFDFNSKLIETLDRSCDMVLDLMDLMLIQYAKNTYDKEISEKVGWFCWYVYDSSKHSPKMIAINDVEYDVHTLERLITVLLHK